MEFKELSQAYKDICENILTNDIGTYATLENLSQLNTENAGFNVLDINSPYFYSKEWRDSGYSSSQLSFDGTCLYILRKGGTFYNFLACTSMTTTENIEIAVVKQHKHSTDYENSEVQDIIEECKITMFKFLHEISKTTALKNTFRNPKNLQFNIIENLANPNYYGISVTLEIKLNYCICD